MKFDFQDVLLVIGVACITGGVYQWNHPAALVVFGFFCLGGVAGRARAPRERKPEGKI